MSEWTIGRMAREAGLSERTVRAYTEGRLISGWARYRLGVAAERKIQQERAARERERSRES